MDCTNNPTVSHGYSKPAFSICDSSPNWILDTWPALLFSLGTLLALVVLALRIFDYIDQFDPGPYDPNKSMGRIFKEGLIELPRYIRWLIWPPSTPYSKNSKAAMLDLESGKWEEKAKAMIIEKDEPCNGKEKNVGHQKDVARNLTASESRLSTLKGVSDGEDKEQRRKLWRKKTLEELNEKAKNGKLSGKERLRRMALENLEHEYLLYVPHRPSFTKEDLEEMERMTKKAEERLRERYKDPAWRARHQEMKRRMFLPCDGLVSCPCEQCWRKRKQEEKKSKAENSDGCTLTNIIRA